MILSAPYVMLGLRWVPPALFLMGTTSTYITAWAFLRAVTWALLPERYYTRSEELLYTSYQSMVAFFFETWSGVQFKYYGHPIPQKSENVLYLSNHQCTVDWVIAEMLCVKQGGSGGRVRYILKNALKYIPIYGWHLGDRGGIFIRRQRDKDQTKLIRAFKEYVEKDTDLWLMIFPEGTRFHPGNEKQLKRSHEYSRSMNLHELDQVLAPKTTGFELAMEHIGNHFSAVYDVTIFYEEMGRQRDNPRAPPPNMFGFFCGQCSSVHVHIRRIPIEAIPKTPEDQRTWLYGSFCEKDKMIEACLHDGMIDDRQIEMPLPIKYFGFPTLFYVSVLSGALLTKYGRRWWAVTFLLFSSYGILKMALIRK